MKALIKDTITATDLARNLASTIDQVRLSGQVIEITKGNQTIARLVPPAHKGFPVVQLKHFLQELSHFENKENARMASDLKAIRDNAALPGASWE